MNEVRKMKLNPEEKRICKKYSSYRNDDNGFSVVDCANCPLVISVKHHACKANISKSDYKRYLKGEYIYD